MPSFGLHLRRRRFGLRSCLRCPRLCLRADGSRSFFRVDDRLVAAQALHLLLQARDLLAETGVRLVRLPKRVVGLLRLRREEPYGRERAEQEDNEKNLHGAPLCR
ncbi:hypothetical protein [Polyangium spumosum]|uniref:Uncharacterized protein n=1 Tax=Polyangium spumosum TaxID=889282 RepID=A0A6N7PWM4_9BACT|nr:hypothetical protein [Polyangium spumosum]MRG94645.1 hypothetical protein [Polyangium spumosum]